MSGYITYKRIEPVIIQTWCKETLEEYLKYLETPYYRRGEFHV
jgi:hypothetical protein